MSAWRASVQITLKPAVNDPQGLAIRDALHQLGFAGVSAARVGKLIELQLEASDQQSAERAVVDMCRRLLANPVIEDFTYEVELIE